MLTVSITASVLVLLTAVQILEAGGVLRIPKPSASA